jgi:hypothetical protein
LTRADALKIYKDKEQHPATINTLPLSRDLSTNPDTPTHNSQSSSQQNKYPMASTQSHPAFPSSRPYSSTLHGKLPERNAPSAFGASANPTARENARLERERQERDRQAPAGVVGGSNPVNALSDEQKEEINEAVSLEDLLEWNRMELHGMQCDVCRRIVLIWMSSSDSSTSTKTKE